MNSKSGGISFFGVLQIVLIVLKLVGVIGWSWWWVLAPLWFPFAFWGIVLILGGIAMFFEKRGLDYD